MKNEIESTGGDDFLILTDLVEMLDEGATGRACIPLTDTDRERLDRMAGGGCDRDEKREVINMLVSNSEAMDYFAGALKGEDAAPSQAG